MGKDKSSFDTARKNKFDDFYTQLKDIREELKNYEEQFRDKVIYLPCDNPEFSQFYYYFYNKFNTLGLKKLICSFYSPRNLFGMCKINPYVTIVDKGKKVTNISIKNDGDFRSRELVQYWKESDIIVTNPPFSLMTEFIDIIAYYQKYFLIISNMTIVGYKPFFDRIKKGEYHISYNKGKNHFLFHAPDAIDNGDKKIKYIEGEKYIDIPSAKWFTNLNREYRDKIILTKKYDNTYIKYDNHNAINVDNISDIPKNYYKVIGVPISFLTKYNPKQFRIVGYRKGLDGKDLSINGKSCFLKLLIQRIK